MINESDNFKVHIIYDEDEDNEDEDYLDEDNEDEDYEDEDNEDEDYLDDYGDLIDSLDEKILDLFIIGVDSIDQAFIKLSKGKKRWIFKPKMSNKTLYREIEDQIREEARNNVYDNEDKKLLKLFVKRYGKRTEEEIAEIFNEKENIINQPEIITPQIIEEKPIIKPYENLQCGIIEPNKNESLYPGRSADIYDIQKLIDEMYSSSAIDGTKGEVSSDSIYYNERNILPFNYIKDNILSDFYNFGYYNDYQYQLEYILFCIYESMPNRINYLNFIRFIAPIRINEYSQETVLDAVIEYFNDISGRVSKEYQRRIDAFQKRYEK